MLELTEENAPHRLPFAAYGVEACVAANSLDVLDRVKQLLPPGSRPCERADDRQGRLAIMQEPDGTYTVWNSNAPISEGQGVELSLVLLDSQIRGYIAINAPGLTFVHAGAVAVGGHGVVFPAHSFAGKSTLVAALVRAGAAYYSDEFAVIDETGKLHPYAKPISIRPAKDERVEHNVESFGGAAGSEPVPLGLVISTYYVPGSEWRPRRLTSGETALALLANAVPVRTRPAEAMKSLRAAAESAEGLEGERGEADEFAEGLLASLRSGV